MSRLRTLGLAAFASVTLSGCMYDGYGSVGLGYGGGYYGGGYYDPYYSPYYGWYDNYYYPGAGIYVYDRYGSRHRWSDQQRHYWEGRRDGNWDGRSRWDGYRRDGSRYSNEERQARRVIRNTDLSPGSPARQDLENYTRRKGTDWRNWATEGRRR